MDLKFVRLSFLSTYCLIASLSVLSHEPVLAQAVTPQPLSDIERLEKRIITVEDSIQKQVQGITTMVQLATIIFATVAGGFALFGVGTYLGLLKEIREKFTKQLDELQRKEQELITSLQKSDELRKKVEDLVTIQGDLAPAALIAKARNVFEQENPDTSDAATYLSQLARIDSSSAEDLFSGAVIAQHYLRNEGLAKSLLKKAKEREGGSYLIDAVLAELHAQDPDWEEHKKILDDLVGFHPQDSNVLAAAGNFFIGRGDWEGLESNMAKAESLCPWLSLPPRNRARAAENLNKDYAIVVGHYTRALKNCTPASDSTTYSWFADYLINGWLPRSNDDLEKAESLLNDVLRVNPEQGEMRLDLAKIKLYQNDHQAAIRELAIGINFCRNSAKRREGQALLSVLGIDVGSVVSWENERSDSSSPANNMP